jgi:SAM-dependent methyltransferase
MPIKIDRARTQDLALQFDEALDLVRNEFEGLGTHRQYRNAFARLLKPDPLGRVLMMGTNQRDLFVPELRRAIVGCVPRSGHIFDFGGGDGRTFALVAASVPEGTRVSIEEPNPEYLKHYVAFLKTQLNLRLGMAVAAGFEEMDTAAARLGETLPQDGSIDFGLAVHMIYFVRDLSSSLIRMVRFLKPGGVLFLVVTDDTVGYTGLVLNRFIEEGGQTARNVSVLPELQHSLKLPAEGASRITEVLQAAGVPVKLKVRRQPSRFYGHNLADLIALSGINVLASVEDLGKFEAAAAVLRDKPEAVDLQIEDAGPRKGMWSVNAGPQWIAVFRRVR